MAALRKDAKPASVTGSPLAPEASRPPTYHQGMRCVAQGHKTGMCQFVGELPSLGPGLWVGLLLDEAVGNSNGKINGRRIFDCPPKYGGFYRSADVERLADKEGEDHSIAAPPSPAAAHVPPGVLKPLPHPGSTLTDDDTSIPEVLAPGRACAARSVAAGRGLQTAVVNQLAQFVITAYDVNGRRCVSGGDGFSVAVRGKWTSSKLRCKFHDHGDGHYTGEYKAEVSGLLAVHIALNGQPLTGVWPTPPPKFEQKPPLSLCRHLGQRPMLTPPAPLTPFALRFTICRECTDAEA